MRHVLCVLACACLLAALPRAAAQQDDATLAGVEVTVTAVAGGSVYLDKGRLSCIEPGDRVRLLPAAGRPFEVVVRSVSKSSARVDLSPAELATAGLEGATVQIGDRGEVLVPAERIAARSEQQAAQDAAAQEAAAAAPPDEPRSVPEHPPWQAPIDDEWDESQPLLAPAFNRTPEEKPTRVRGRIYTMLSRQQDDVNDNTYSLYRLGTEVFIENPFQEGGEIHLDGELYRKDADLAFGNGETSTQFRLDRASYAWGGTRTEPDRWEIGRFLQHEFPELGVIDGVEYSHRLSGGNRVGGSLGYMPDPFDFGETGQDGQVAVFYRTDSSGNDPFEFGLAYQNTWYKGNPDRNLLVANFDYLPHPDVSVYGGAWIDYYGPGDDVKDEGIELTEARLNGIWRLTPDSGFGVHAARIRYPELLRLDYQTTLAEQILNNHVTRVGASGWHRFDEHFRIDGRVDGWRDQDDTGGSGDARLVVRNLLYDRGEVAVGAFTTEGSFSYGSGLRLSASRSIGARTLATLAWELARFQQQTANDEYADDFQTLRASLDTGFGTSWNVSLFVERRKGDEQDSYNLGVFVQERF